MAIKSEAEVALIRESVRVGEPGAHGSCSATRGPARPRRRSRSARATRRRSRCSMRSAQIYRAQSFVETGAGRRLSRPDRAQRGHPSRARRQPRLPGRATCSSPARARPSGATTSELERTMVIGAADRRRRRGMFAHMLALQDLALDAIQPGRVVRGRRPGRPRVLRGARPVARAGATTPGTRSACATTRGRSSTRATRRRSVPAWSSPSSRASTRPSSAASGTPTPCSSRSRAVEMPDVLPARPREPRHSGVTAWVPSPST